VSLAHLNVHNRIVKISIDKVITMELNSLILKKKALMSIFLALTTVLAWNGLAAADVVFSPPPQLSVNPLDLSRVPRTQELMASGQLGGLLYPTYGPIDETVSTSTSVDLASTDNQAVSKLSRAEAINLSFGEAIKIWNRHEYKKGQGPFWCKNAPEQGVQSTRCATGVC
jgi:hypothetical protein